MAARRRAILVLTGLPNNKSCGSTLATAERAAPSCASTVTSNVQSGAPAPAQVTGIVAVSPSLVGSNSAGMAAKLAGVQEMAGVGEAMRPLLSIAEASRAKRASVSAPTVCAGGGGSGHVSVGVSARVLC